MNRKSVLIVFLMLVASCAAWSSQSGNWSSLIDALIMVESGGNPQAHNQAENAIGVLQIRPVMVAEYNRITGQAVKHKAAWSPEFSRQMAFAILSHYANIIKMETGRLATDKELAFCWNGGLGARKRVENPKNDLKQKRLEKYWRKVEHALFILR